MLVVAALAQPVLGLVPVAGDRVVYEGTVRPAGGVWEHGFSLNAGWSAAGLYLAVAGIEAFSVRLNDSLVAEVSAGAAPRTLVRVLDFSTRVGLLRPGSNRLELVTPEPADSFVVRCWASPRAWYMGSPHSHTVYSDGALTVHQILADALRDGGQFLAITDHNTMAQCADSAFHEFGPLRPMRGMEWTTDSGHANLLGLQGAADVGLGAVTTMIDDASYRGALVQVNHPCAWEWRWWHYPVLDPGIDGIELMNGRTGYSENTELAIAWWDSLIGAGRTVAAIGSSDFHEYSGGTGPLKPCSRVWASSNHPDSLLYALKFGRVMACDRPDGSRVYLYADTSGSGRWEVVAGGIVAIRDGSRPVRFRVEAESVSPNEELVVLGRHGESQRVRFDAPGDFSREWTSILCSTDTGFVRAELRRAGGEAAVVTNPIYINHVGYELGPTELHTDVALRSESQSMVRSVLLEVKLACEGAVSPYRYGLMVALDTTYWQVLTAKRPGVSSGVARITLLAGHQVIEWCGGYEWGTRLRPGETITFWARLRPLRPGPAPVLCRSWASDRLVETAVDPVRDAPGPDGRQWHARMLSPEQDVVNDVTPGTGVNTVLAVTNVTLTRAVAKLTVDMPPDAGSLRLDVFDNLGRSRLAHEFQVAAGPDNTVEFGLVDIGGTRLPAGVYFVRASAGGTTVARRLQVVD